MQDLVLSIGIYSTVMNYAKKIFLKKSSLNVTYDITRPIVAYIRNIFQLFDNFTWYWGMGILFEGSKTYICRMVLIFFSGFMRSLWLTREFFPFFHASICHFFKMICEKLQCDIWKNCGWIGNSMFIIKFKIWLQL